MVRGCSGYVSFGQKLEVVLKGKSIISFRDKFDLTATIKRNEKMFKKKKNWEPLFGRKTYANSNIDVCGD